MHKFFKFKKNNYVMLKLKQVKIYVAIHNRTINCAITIGINISCWQIFLSDFLPTTFVNLTLEGL